MDQYLKVTLIDMKKCGLYTLKDNLFIRENEDNRSVWLFLRDTIYMKKVMKEMTSLDQGCIVQHSCYFSSVMRDVRKYLKGGEAFDAILFDLTRKDLNPMLIEHLFITIGFLRNGMLVDFDSGMNKDCLNERIVGNPKIFICCNHSFYVKFKKNKFRISRLGSKSDCFYLK